MLSGFWVSLILSGSIPIWLAKAGQPLFWQENGLTIVAFLVFLGVFAFAMALPALSHIEWDDETLVYRGFQVQTRSIGISDIAAINVVLVQGRGGVFSSLEIVSVQGTRFQLPTSTVDRVQLQKLLESLAKSNPKIRFDERAELLSQGRTLPTS